MKAYLHLIHSPDADDLRTFEPTHSAFSLLLQMRVGPDSGSGEESFDVLLCTPDWLREKIEPVIGRHKLIVTTYDYGHIERFLTEQVDSCTGETWEEVATKVGRIGRWEFEDYKGIDPR
ncbi:MAG: immunity 8 family protein [Candidatus Dormibacteraceae bacterium]